METMIISLPSLKGKCEICQEETEIKETSMQIYQGRHNPIINELKSICDDCLEEIKVFFKELLA